MNLSLREVKNANQHYCLQAFIRQGGQPQWIHLVRNSAGPCGTGRFFNPWKASLRPALVKASEKMPEPAINCKRYALCSLQRFKIKDLLTVLNCNNTQVTRMHVTESELCAFV